MNVSYEMGEPLTQQKLDEAIIRLITKKLMPISMVEDEYFREFVLSMFDYTHMKYKFTHAYFDTFEFLQGYLHSNQKKIVH